MFSLDFNKPVHAGAVAILAALSKVPLTIDRVTASSPFVGLAVRGVVDALGLAPEVHAGETLLNDALNVARQLVSQTNEASNGELDEIVQQHGSTFADMERQASANRVANNPNAMANRVGQDTPAGNAFDAGGDQTPQDSRIDEGRDPAEPRPGPSAPGQPGGVAGTTQQV